MTPAKRTTLAKNKHQTGHHWQATIHYRGGYQVTRVYRDYDKAAAFALRQGKSRSVTRTQIVQID